MELIKTSDRDWLKNVLQHCKDGTPFRFVDDFGLGFSRKDLSNGLEFLAKANRSGVDWMRIAQALAAVGFTGIGVWLVRLAVIDPEPTSKLSLMIAGGVACILVGGVALFYTLKCPINLKVNVPGFDFECTFAH